jgi:hypothetical protein
MRENGPAKPIAPPKKMYRFKQETKVKNWLIGLTSAANKKVDQRNKIIFQQGSRHH